MRVLVIGASGRTGQLAMNEILKRGHEVIALVRKTSSLAEQKDLTIVQGTPANVEDLDHAFTLPVGKPDAVLVTLAASRTSDSPFAKPVTPRFFMRDAVHNTLATMEKHGVRKIVIMSVFGAGSSAAELPWLIKAMFTHTNMSFQTEDHNAVDADVRRHDKLDYTLVRPPMLKEGDALPVKEAGETGKGIGMFASITRNSVAQSLADALEKDTWSRKAVVLTN